MTAKKTTPVEDQLKKLNRTGTYRVHNIGPLVRKPNGLVFHVYFLPIEDLNGPAWETIDAVDRYRGQSTGAFSIELNAGSLPCVAYNLVFENCKQRADINLKRRTRFVVDLTTQSFASGSVVPASTFGPLYQFATSQLLKLRAHDSDGPIDLYVPCFEVFRVYYGANSKITNGLLSGNWDEARNEIVNVSECFTGPDGEWNIVLRSKMAETEGNAKFGGLLAWDGFGVACVKQVEASLPSGKLNCILPSQKASLALAGEALFLPHDTETNARRALLLKIVRSDDPLPADIVVRYIKEVGGIGESVIGAGPGVAAPFSGYTETLVAAEDVESDEPANPVSGMESVSTEALSLIWDTSVVAEKLKKKQSISYGPGEKIGKREVGTSSTAVTGGKPATALQENVTADYGNEDDEKTDEPSVQESELPEQFRDLLVDFDNLTKEVKSAKGQIQRYSLIETRRPKVGARYGRHDLWMIPQKYVTPSGNERRVSWGWANANTLTVRGVMVVEIYLKDFDTPLYWLELLQGTSSYRSVILATSNDIQLVVDTIISRWTIREPIMPPDGCGWVFEDIAVGTTWRHCNTDGRLASIMRALLKIARA